MKKLFICMVLFIALKATGYAQTTPESQAAEIAQKMKDTLTLSEQQKSQIQTATTAIQNTKLGLRQLYTGRALEYYLSMEEKNRDSLYKNILPENKYTLYLEKKSTMLTNY